MTKPDLPGLEDFLREKQAAGQAVYLANYNSLKQVVLAGEKQLLPELGQEIADRKLAKRAIPLDVAGAFHTPLYQAASRKMGQRLKNETFSAGTYPVISNTTCQPFVQEDLAKVLEVQLMVPTHFDACVKGLLDLGMTASLEIGPGHALSTFAKQTDKGLKTWQVGSLAEYQQFVEEEQNGFTK